MKEAIFKKHVDDFKAISTKAYITARKKHFSHLDEDFSHLSGYDTIVTLALSYPKGTPPYKGKGYGMITRYAHGHDYHLVYKEKLQAIERELNALGIKSKGTSDISLIDERFAAYLSGLGYIGYNQFLIHPKYGTHLYLATVLINRPLEIAPHLYQSCGECRKCIDACPTQALSTKGFIRERCLSFKTQEKRPYDLDVIKDFNFLFGCDICQDVCPKNKGISPIEREVFESDDAAQLNLENILLMSNKQFQRTYGHYAFAWRGGLVIKRNAIALLYTQGLDDKLPLVEKTYNDYKHVPWFEKTVRQILNTWRQI
jgi:epoxyqueuosine reductase